MSIPRRPLSLWSKYRRKRHSSFPVGAFFNKLESYSGGKTWQPDMGSCSPSPKKVSVFPLSKQLEKIPIGTRNILKQPGTSTVALFSRENDSCEDA